MSVLNAIALGVALLCFFCTQVIGQEDGVPESTTTRDPTEIPIAEVWSNRIKGTRDIFELEPSAPPHIMKFRREFRSSINGGETLTQQIDKRFGLGRSQEWCKWRNKNWENKREDPPLEPMKMFAVLGHGQAALTAAHSVLVKGEKPQQVFSRDDDITVIFFSHRSNEIQLRRILRKDNQLTIVYQIALPHDGSSVFSEHVHVALIPVSSLKPKELVVNLERLPCDEARNEQILLNLDSVSPEVTIENTVSRPFRVAIK